MTEPRTGTSVPFLALLLPCDAEQIVECPLAPLPQLGNKQVNLRIYPRGLSTFKVSLSQWQLKQKGLSSQ